MKDRVKLQLTFSIDEELFRSMSVIAMEKDTPLNLFMVACMMNGFESFKEDSMSQGDIESVFYDLRETSAAKN